MWIRLPPANRSLVSNEIIANLAAICTAYLMDVACSCSRTRDACDDIGISMLNRCETDPERTNQRRRNENFTHELKYFFSLSLSDFLEVLITGVCMYMRS